MMSASTRYRFETLFLLVVYFFAGIVVYRIVDAWSLEWYLSCLTGVLVFYTLVCGGWPLSYPLGVPKLGVVMSAVFSLVGLAAAAYVIAMAVMWSGFEPYVYGVSLVAVVIAWGLGLEAWPLRHYHPINTVRVGAPVAVLSSILLMLLLHKFSTEFARLFVIIFLTVVFVFSPAACFQGYPFYRLWRQPRIGFSILFVGVVFATVATLSGFQGFSSILSAGLLSGIVFWIVVYSWGLLYPLVLGKRQPVRGVVTLALSTITAAPWVYLLRMLEADPIDFNLLVLLPLYIVHNNLFMRKPFSRYVMPSMVLQGQDSAEKLFGWRL